MCYDVQTLTKKIIKYAESRGVSPEEIAILVKELDQLKDKKPIFHTNAYEHRELPVFTAEKPLSIQFYKWGLIPNTYITSSAAQEIRTKTLNARSETIFELPSFKESITCRRCLVMVDGFYEHHHKNGKTYPFYIQKASEEPIYLAGIYDTAIVDGKEEKTVSIITTEGNTLLSKIHNNPKMKAPRMPVILDKEDFDQWFTNPAISQKQHQQLQQLFKSYNTEALKAHTVAKIRGKEANPTNENAASEFIYKELRNGVDSISNSPEQLNLF